MAQSLPPVPIKIIRDDIGLLKLHTQLDDHVTKDLQSILGTLAISLGGIGGALALLDWSLSKKSKRWIENKASTIWIWLSYQQTWPLLLKLQHKQAFTVFLTIGALLFVVGGAITALSFFFWLVPPSKISTKAALLMSLGGLLLLLLMMTPSICIIYAMRRRLRDAYTWITTTSSTAQLSLRAFGSFTTIFISIYFLPDGWLTFQFVLAHPIYAVAGIVIFSLFAMVITLLLYAIGTICCYLLCIFLLVLIFRIFQSLILRIVEHEKGPVLAIAAFLAAVGSVLTALAR